MNDGKRQVTDETEPDENPIATIYYENGTELTGKAVTLQDGTVGVRIPGEFFKTALLPDGSMPDGVISVDIGPKHVEGGLPLTEKTGSPRTRKWRPRLWPVWRHKPRLLRLG